MRTAPRSKTTMERDGVGMRSPAMTGQRGSIGSTMTAILQASADAGRAILPSSTGLVERPGMAPGTTVRIGINPITWSNDDLPELGGATPLETCLAETREAGYAGIELGNKFPRRAETLRPLLDRHGLALVSGWYSGRLLERSAAEESAAIEEHLALLAAMGCGVLIFAETADRIAGARGTPLSRRPRLAASEWEGFGAKLTALAEHVATRGLALAYHHHMGTIVESAEEIDRLMDGTGAAVGLLLDTGHLAHTGADPLAVALPPIRRNKHVHFQDVRP